MNRDVRLIVIAGIVSITAIILAILASLFLEDTGRRNVIEELAKLCIQLVVIVVAGALVKKAIDDVQEHQARLVEAAETRRAYIRRLIDAAHLVDRARVLVLANRSVRTWSTQIEVAIIEAYVSLRNVRHDLVTAAQANAPVFEMSIVEQIGEMVSYLQHLIDEFGEKKKDYSEAQIQAEKDRSKQPEVWKLLSELTWLGDLTRDGEGYKTFRNAYNRALTEMRSTHSARPSG
jgi:hypothetical protein